MARQKFDRNLVPPFPDLTYEIALWRQGLQLIAGVDEAGRGALAGPVSAGAVIMPVDPELTVSLRGVRDSKQMTPGAREHWAERLQSVVCCSAVGYATNQEIDTLGIVPATRLAIQRALEALLLQPQHLLVDYLDLPNTSIPQTSLVQGDRRSLSIAAASILAKTGRDARLRQLDLEFPGYGFAQHKGYGTMAHRRALAQLGPSPVHRHSFAFSTPSAEI